MQQDSKANQKHNYTSTALLIPTKNKPEPPKQDHSHKKLFISRWILVLFISSLIFFISTVFVSRWTSSGPSFFSPDELNSSIYEFQQGFKQLGDTTVVSTPSTNKFQKRADNVEKIQVDTLTHLQSLNKSRESKIPKFLQIPSDNFELLLPTIGIIYICVLLAFTPANNWTRLVVNAIFLLVMGRYFIWRTFTTINFSHWASIIFGLLIYAVETIGLFSFVLYLLQSTWSNARLRSQQANSFYKHIISGEYLPSVDVFVPTYNEPESVVRRTVIGCQAMDYSNKKVYILDDTRRPHIRALAKTLGCEYITRPDNQHAKAGNINNAYPQTTGELIVIMDADFVPFKHFLNRTVGFFKQPNLALLQTPQTFYNPDFHARNLGIDHLVHDDLASFFGFSQACRDVTNTVLCCGTSYVVRRTALESVDGYSTICLAEDSPTSIKMLTIGWQVQYLEEILSMGESTRNYIDFVKQRVRWHHSNYQIFCCGKDLPIWSTMNWLQKMYFLTFYIGSFNPLFRVIFMLTPTITLITGVPPINSTPGEILYYLVPYFLLLIASQSWRTGYTASFFWNEVYETILCFPTLQCLLFAIRNPFGLAFKVTRKGVKSESKNYNIEHILPLIVTMLLMIAVLCMYLVGFHTSHWQTATSGEFGLMFFLLCYNIVVIGIAILASIDQPERRNVDRFPLRTPCKFHLGEHTFTAYTTNVSEGGTNISLAVDVGVKPNQIAIVEFVEYGLSVEAKVCRSYSHKQEYYLAVEFINLNLEANKKLVEILYCDMTWWKKAKRPGAIDIFLAMFSAFLGMRSLRTKYD
jgi:cellulose synthase (UDP-forming)